jgi:hypothetical protein
MIRVFLTVFFLVIAILPIVHPIKFEESLMTPMFRSPSDLICLIANKSQVVFIIGGDQRSLMFDIFTCMDPVAVILLTEKMNVFLNLSNTIFPNSYFERMFISLSFSGRSLPHNQKSYFDEEMNTQSIDSLYTAIHKCPDVIVIDGESVLRTLLDSIDTLQRCSPLLYLMNINDKSIFAVVKFLALYQFELSSHLLPLDLHLQYVDISETIDIKSNLIGFKNSNGLYQKWSHEESHSMLLKPFAFIPKVFKSNKK